MKRKLAFVLLVFCVIFTLCACGNAEAKKAVAAGEKALVSGNYEEAAEQFKFALENGYDNEKTEKQYNALTGYFEAKEYLDDGDIDNARAAAEKIETSLIEGMEERVILLNGEIGVREDEITANDATLIIIKNLIENGHYPEAKNAIDIVSLKNLSDKQINQLDIISSNLATLSSATRQPTDTDDPSSSDSANFTTLDAFNNANNYLLAAAETDPAYAEYSAINSIEGPYTDSNGTKYYIVPVGIQINSGSSVEFYINVYSDGTIEEYDY